MIKSKKGQVLLYGAVVGIIVAVIVSIVVDFKKKDFEIIGSSSLALLNTVKEAESSLFYIDQSAKYALQQSVYELAKNGGFVSEFEINEFNVYQPFVKNECGKFRDVFIWYTIKKDASGKNVKYSCIDESKEFLETNLKYYFNKNLNEYLLNSPYNIPRNNYDYEVKDNLEMMGKAKSALRFDILKDETKPVVKKPVEIQVEQLKLKDFTDDTEIKLCAKGAKCRLTEEAYQLLLKAEEIAEKKYRKRLVIHSAFRTQEEQIAIWNKFAATYPDVKERSKIVCNPINEKCPHTTGNAIDVFFEEKTTKTMKNIDWVNLHEIMSQAGWVRYGDEKNILSGEPWHYECCGTDRQKRAQAKGVTAII